MKDYQYFVGVVVIGRNEGERLKKAFKYVKNFPSVYVDSGSTDNSIAIAESEGMHVISLTEERPFSAARGRNTGFQYLKERFPSIKYVQFIDGDCELFSNWLETGYKILEKDPKISVLFGDLLERNPEHSFYNLLCSMEWKASEGDSNYFPGIIMIRASVFEEVGGYNPEVIAGEDPELSVRIKTFGYKIYKTNNKMALHDANMLKFSQWVMRTARSGYSIGLRADISGKSSLKDCIKERKSIYFWAFTLPLTAIIGSLISPIILFIIFSCYLLLFCKIHRYRTNKFNESFELAAIYSFFCIIGKFPEFYGLCLYQYRKHYNKFPKLIEHK